MQLMSHLRFDFNHVHPLFISLKKRGCLENQQICHIEFIEMRTNLLANHCQISA